MIGAISQAGPMGKFLLFICCCFVGIPLACSPPLLICCCFCWCCGLGPWDDEDFTVGSQNSRDNQN